MNEEIIRQAQKERDEFLQSRPKNGNNDFTSHNLEKKRYSSPLTIEAILAQPDIEEEWVVNSIVIQNGITTVSGLPNHFKSLFVQMLVKSVASGTPFLGKFEAHKGSVLIIDREIPTVRLKRRWRAIGVQQGYDIYFYPYSDPFKLDNAQDAKRLEELIDEHKFKLIVIDTFNRSHTGKETNSYSEMAGVFEPLKKLLEKTSIILIHHSNKTGYKSEVPTPDELMGSTDFAAETDILFTIRKKGKDTLLVHNLKAKDSPLIDPFSLLLKTYEDGVLDLEYQGEIEAPATPHQVREEEIIEFLKLGKKLRAEIMAHMAEKGEKSGTINNALTALRGKGIIASDLVGKEARYFLVETYRNEAQERFLPTQDIGIGKQGIVIKPCYVCGSRKLWRRQDGDVVCAVCHPAPTEENVKEWIEVEEDEKV